MYNTHKKIGGIIKTCTFVAINTQTIFKNYGHITISSLKRNLKP